MAKKKKKTAVSNKSTRRKYHRCVFSSCFLDAYAYTVDHSCLGRFSASHHLPVLL